MDASGLLFLQNLRVQNTQTPTVTIVNTQPIVRLEGQTNTLASANVDAILVALDGNGLLNGKVDLSGQTPPAPPSATGIAAALSLTGKGWTVTTDTGVYWGPATEQVTWIDTNGTFTDNLANFRLNADLATVTSMVFGATGNVTYLVGLNYVPALVTLDVNTNALASLDCTGLAALTTLDCHSNPSLTTLTLTGCAALVTLNCAACALTALDVTPCTALDNLICSQNPFNVGTTLNLSNCTVLNNLACENCPGLQVINMTNIGNMTGGIIADSNNSLTTLTTPDVTFVAGDLAIFNCPNLLALSLPLCTDIQGDFLFYSSGIVTVNLPLVIETHNFNGSNCLALTTVSAPALVDIFNPMDLSGCTALTSVTFTLLSNPSGGTLFTGCTSLVNLSLPAVGLNTNGLHCAGCSSLTTVSMPNLTVSRDAELTGCNLNQATVDALLALYVTLLGTGDPFTIDMSVGTSSAPSAGGLVDKATINAFNPGVDFAITN